jgi:hypothetical protein
MESGMEAANEQRIERRLYYRWPVRFAYRSGEKFIQGQAVDVNSSGMAFFCRSGAEGLRLGQQITTDFGVPHFNSGDSFDTVFFSRSGRVCRVDDLKNQVRRIVIRFAEPLFFRPGEQNVSEADSQRRLKNKAMSMVRNEEKERIYNEVLAGARERIRAYAEAKDEALEKLKAEIELRCRIEEAAKIETQAREKAEQKLKSEAMLRAKAEKRARAEAEKRLQLEADFEQKLKPYQEVITRMKEELRDNTGVSDQRIFEIEDKAKPGTKGVLKKVGGFIKDRDRIF